MTPLGVVRGQRVKLKCYYPSNCREFGHCVRDITDSELTLEINPEILTLTPGTPCISNFIWKITLFTLLDDKVLNFEIVNRTFVSFNLLAPELCF